MVSRISADFQALFRLIRRRRTVPRLGVIALVVVLATASYADGPVIGWGLNNFGQATPPGSVDGTTGTASAISAAMESKHSCAIQSGSGNVICWGLNQWGESTPPGSVDGTTGTASAIDVGFQHTCAIQSGSGIVVCWGNNGSGQATPPGSVDGTTGTAGAISAGAQHSCAIQSGSGNLVCWGGGPPGQATPPGSLDGTTGTAGAVAVGFAHTCAIQSGSGNVICWGENFEGESTPPSSVNGTTGTASAIASGRNYSCAIQSGSGIVVCWGNNIAGQSTPPGSVNGTTGTAGAIATGTRHSCAIQTGSGSVVCWGRNDYGETTPPGSVDGTTATAGASTIAVGGAHSLVIHTACPSIQIGSGTQLFTHLCTSDASQLSESVFNSSTLNIDRTPTATFYLSSSGTGFFPIAVDDVVEINGIETGLGPYVQQPGIPSFVLGIPIESNLVPLPPHNVTSMIPLGSGSVTFDLRDTQPEIYGNTALYLVRDCTIWLDESENGQTRITWLSHDVDINGSVSNLDVVSGNLAELRTNQDFTNSCLLGTFPGMKQVEDARPDPAVGNGYYYLVNGTCARALGYGDSSLQPDSRDALPPIAACP